MGNPMLLMMGFSLVMVMGLPALLKSIPPEELEEMTKNQVGLFRTTRYRIVRSGGVMEWCYAVVLCKL